MTTIARPRDCSARYDAPYAKIPSCAFCRAPRTSAFLAGWRVQGNLGLCPDCVARATEQLRAEAVAS